MKALSIWGQDVGDERLGTIGLHQMKSAASKSTAHHPSAELCRVSLSELDQVIELGAADLIQISKTLMRCVEETSKEFSLPGLKQCARLLDSRILLDDMTQPSGPCGVHIEHVQFDVSEVTNRVSTVESDQTLCTVSDSIGIATMSQLATHTRVEDDPAQSAEVRLYGAHPQISKVDLEDASRLAEE